MDKILTEKKQPDIENDGEAILTGEVDENGHEQTTKDRIKNHEAVLETLKKRFIPAARFNNRELSWLEFNERVLEEAFDPTVPVIERIKFLAICASNLDEFFMVRVATVRRQIEAGVNLPGPDGMAPQEVMEQITARVNQQHENMGRCFEEVILPELIKAGIHLVDENSATIEQVAFANKYFNKNVKPLVTPLAIDSTHPFPSLHNKMLYFCVERWHRPKAKKKSKPSLTLVQIPSHVLGRFYSTPF